MRFNTPVWERIEGPDTLSKRAYVAAITLFTVFGLALASFIAYQARSWHFPSPWIFMGICLGLPIVGIIISLLSKRWMVSLLGYIMIVIGIGTVIGPTIALIKTAIIFNALLATGGVAIIMSIIGIIYPGSLESWGGYLGGALSALLLVRIVQMVFPMPGMQSSVWYLAWIDYASALLFSLYILFDWNRALFLPHTLDNAVDVAVAIFLDIANLFIVLLRISAENQENNS